MWVTSGAVIVLAAVALVVAALAEGDRRPVRPRRTGTVTAEELRGADLPIAWRGYDRGHVDALLARAATTLEEVHRYGAPGEPADPELEAPAERVSGRPPSFLAGAFADSAPEPSATAEEPDDVDEPLPPVDEAESDVPLAAGDDDSSSGEELEDRRGDGAGGLDR